MPQSDSTFGLGAKRTVLVVEDNEINREVLSANFEDFDYEVLQAENGFVGLDLLEKHYTDISAIILDIHMPECDGFEFLRRKALDERYSSVPVVVATASSSMEDEIKCLKLGANDFVGKPYQIEIIVNRINNIIRLRESASIVNQLMYDGITGLYSKSFFNRRVEDVFRERPNDDFDMICSDIENFKALNDRYGEKNCDRILHDIAERLVESLPGLVCGGRISGDVFAFLVDHRDADWEHVLTGISADVHLTTLNLKYGIVECVDKELAVSLTCDRAVIALERIKGPLGIGVSWYDDALREEQLMEQTIIDTMEQALEEHQFIVNYQPKHHVRRDTIGGAEALVRWIHPDLGFISPGVFIPLFERYGFITKLDMYIWEEACKEIARCRDMGLPLVPISVNASRLDFDVPDLADQIAAMVDRYGIDHALLHVELTETAYSDDPERVTETIKELRAYGFGVELDDFGAGYSSLASLNELPLDVLKLDMSLIRQASRLGDFRIVQSAIRMAHILGLEAVVEGVEVAEEVEKLKEMDCDLIQGYYFSRPLKQEEFEEYLAK